MGLDLSKFRGLQELQIDAAELNAVTFHTGPPVFPVSCLADLKTLRCLSLTFCKPTGFASFLSHVSLRELNLEKALLQERITSNTLVKISIDWLTPAHSLFLIPTDLPNIQLVEIGGFNAIYDVMGVDDANTNTLQSMAVSLAALPLRPLLGLGQNFSFTADSRWEVHQPFSSLRALSSSVFCQLKSVNLLLAEGPGPKFMAGFSRLFYNVEMLICANGWCDPEGVYEAVIGMPLLKSLSMRLKNGDSVPPSLMPALLTAATKRPGQPFMLIVRAENHEVQRQLHVIQEQWTGLLRRFEKTMLGRVRMHVVQWEWW